MCNIQQENPSDTLKSLDNSNSQNSSLTDEQKQRNLYEYEKYMRKLDLIGDRKYDTCHLELSIKNGDITLNKIYIIPDKDGNAIINIPDFVDSVACSDTCLLETPVDFDYTFNTIKLSGQLGRIDSEYGLIVRSFKNHMRNFDLQEVNFDGYTKLYRWFNGDERLESITFGYGGKTITKMQDIFLSCKKLKKINFNQLDFQNVENIDGLFCNCIELEQIDLRTFKNQPIKQMRRTFQHCKKLKEIDITQMNCENLQYLEKCFINSGLERFQFRGCNIKDLLYLGETFKYCESLKTIDFGDIYVKNLYETLAECQKLEEVNINGLHTELCTTFGGFVQGCESLHKLDTQKIDFSSVTQLQGMFQGSGLIEIDLSNKDFRQLDNKIKDKYSPEVDNRLLRSIINQEWEAIEKSYKLYDSFQKEYTDIQMQGLFSYCFKLQSVNLSGCIFPPFNSFLYWFEHTPVYQVNLENCDLRYCSFEDREQFTIRREFLNNSSNLFGLKGQYIKHLYIKGIKADPEKLDKFLDSVKYYNPGIEIHT